MRVVYLIEGPAPYGANKSLLDLIDYLRPHGIEPLVVGSTWGPLSDWLTQRGIKYLSIGHRFSTYPKADTWKKKIGFVPAFLAFRLLNFIALCRLIFICRKFNPDLIHTNIGPSCIGYLAARYLKIKHVWHLREYQDLDFGMRIFPSKKSFIAKLLKSDLVICVTNAVKSHFGSPVNAVVVNNGVCWKADIKGELGKGGYFLFVGRLEKTKGIEEVISAYKESAPDLRSRFRLVIAGNGEKKYVDHLKASCGDLIGQERIEFLGFRNDTAELMKRADALIVASGSEGFGRITAEAMCYRCLAIGRATGGTAELLEPSEGKPVGLTYLSDAELKTKMALIGSPGWDPTEILDQAQKRALERFCVEAYGSAVLSQYRKLMA